jgi:signal transduction histidine kinase/CheY-like chemotaxis protein
VVWPDGSLHWVFAKGKARFETVDDERRLVSFDGTVMDITEQRMLREELRDAAARLSEADHRKDEFLATLAHELRNPLAPIRTGLDILRLSDDDPEARRRIREMMARQTENIVHLVDDLLDVARITRGKMQLKRSRVDIASVVQSAMEATKSLMAEAGHELSVKLPESPVYLDGDATRLSQILSNLLDNAGKYTKSSGQIALTVEASDDEVVISVTDNGQGIPDSLRKTIFEMFAQAHRSQEDNVSSGLGIGLTLVKSLVQMHGGTIEVNSEGITKGSEFIVRLPRENSLAAPSLIKEAATQTTNFRVLVVDDNEDAAKVLCMLIERMGNDIRIAHDGQQAIEVAEEFLPEIIFMDIGMPRMNGNEAARRIRQQPWGKAMKLVALTGWSQENDLLRSREAGFDTHLVKPANSDAIRTILADLDVASR